MISIVRGDDVILDIAVTDQDTGEPVDLTGSRLWWYLKRRVRDVDEDAIHRSGTAGLDNTENEIDIEDAPGGIAVVAIDNDATDGWPVGVWHWELQGQDNIDVVRTLATGRIRVVEDVVIADADAV